MKTIIKSIVLSLLLTACGAPNKTDAEFTEYVETFEKEAKAHGRGINLDFSIVLADSLDTSTKQTGVCDDNGIRILKSLWNSSSRSTKEALIYHELGHCALGRGHLDDLKTNGLPLSIMNSHWDSVSRAVEITGVDNYLGELFTTTRAESAKTEAPVESSDKKVKNEKVKEVKDEKVKPKETPSPTPTIVECNATTPKFLDIKSLRFYVIDNLDGTRDVACALIDNAGTEFSHKEHYDSSSDEGLNYFAFCTVYYKASHNIVFNIPGYLNPKNPLVLTDIGFQVSGMPESPSDGYDYSPKTCVKK